MLLLAIKLYAMRIWKICVCAAKLAEWAFQMENINKAQRLQLKWCDVMTVSCDSIRLPFFRIRSSSGTLFFVQGNNRKVITWWKETQATKSWNSIHPIFRFNLTSFAYCFHTSFDRFLLHYICLFCFELLPFPLNWMLLFLCSTRFS